MFNKLPTWAVVAILLISIATIYALNQTGTDSTALVVKTLQSEGATEIRVQPGSAGNCTTGEVAYDFVAIKNEQPVSGLVCVNIHMDTAYIRYR